MYSKRQIGDEILVGANSSGAPITCGWTAQELSIAKSSPENRFSCPFHGVEPADRTSIEELFCNIPAVVLGQFWAQSRKCHPGWAKCAQTNKSLLVLADFEDEDVFNPVVEFNQPAYQYGDVCEVFWRPQDGNQYAEIHVTPEGAIWQAVFPIDWMERKRRGLLPEAKIEDLLVWEPQPRVLNWRTRQGWATFVAIPFSILGITGAAGKIAICRYDYTPGEATPILSSTAALPKCDFHLHEFWNAIEFPASNLTTL